jgi:hypothetical protein
MLGFGKLVQWYLRYQYRQSGQMAKDLASFKERTGFDLDNPTLKRFKWIPKDHSVPGSAGGYFSAEGKKYKPIKGEMVEFSS